MTGSCEWVATEGKLGGRGTGGQRGDRGRVEETEEAAERHG